MKKGIAIAIILVLSFPVVVEAKEDYVEKIMNEVNEEMILNYLQTLESFGPRVTGTQACWDAGNYIYNEFKSYGYETYFFNWSLGSYSDRNVVAVLPGERNDSIIICAHYDSVPGSPGADDNGSGTAAVLAAAKALSKYKDKIKLTYTIRFVTFSGEEEGLLGSQVYAKSLYENNSNVVAVLNVDMIGYTRSEQGKENVIIFESDESKWITNVAISIAEKYSYLNLKIHRYGAGANSDHWPFMVYGYDAVFFHEYEFNDYYHSSGDTVEHMDIEYDTRVTKLIVATLVQIANIEIVDDVPPEISIQRPANYLYIADREVMETNMPIIIGKITIKMDAIDEQSGIEKVDVLIDNELKAELTNRPYEWTWDEFAFFKHEIKATAYDNVGNYANATIDVIIFNV